MGPLLVEEKTWGDFHIRKKSGVFQIHPVCSSKVCFFIRIVDYNYFNNFIILHSSVVCLYNLCSYVARRNLHGQAADIKSLYSYIYHCVNIRKHWVCFPISWTISYRRHKPMEASFGSLYAHSRVTDVD